MTSAGFTISGDDHPISPVMLGDAQLASDMADDMLSKFPFKKKKCIFQNIYIFFIDQHFQNEEYSLLGSVIQLYLKERLGFEFKFRLLIPLRTLIELWRLSSKLEEQEM